MAASTLTELLDSQGVAYELLPHEHTERAADEAAALGVPADSVAKTLVLAVPDGYVRVVLAASDRLDLHKVREIVGEGKKKVHLATEDDLQRDFPEFELGAAPPVGGRRDPVLLDQAIAGREQIVFEAGDHDESVRLSPADLQRLAEVRVVDVRED
ncbi:MAG TPA: YbaK/EbsC family protein [Gaiellaceae bacterium]|nr:YbaK/EbsC family protein [Gaiellaceae bacterium]